MVFLTGCDGRERKKLFLFSGFVDFTMIATLKPYKKGKKKMPRIQSPNMNICHDLEMCLSHNSVYWEDSSSVQICLESVRGAMPYT